MTTSSLADALSNSDDSSVGITSDDSAIESSPDSQDDPGGNADVQAAPDISSLPPNSSTPTGNLQTMLSPQNNPAQDMPITAAPPPGLKGLGGRLRGVLYGLATGGPVGALTGAVAPNAALTRYNQNQDMRAAKVRFATAQAAEAVAHANRADQLYQWADEDHQIQLENHQLAMLDEAQRNGFVVRAVTPLDQGVAANAAAALNNLEQITKTDGAVGNMLHLHVGDKILSLQLRDPIAGLNMVNLYRKAQGLEPYTPDFFSSLSQEERNNTAIAMMNFTDPGRGDVNPQTLTTLQTRLGLVKAQPDFTGKDTIVGRLQNAVDLQTDILNRANQRTAEQKAAASQIESTQDTANKVAATQALAGPEAAAAGQKAEATARGTAKGTVEGQMSALGGSTSTGTVNPQTGADEGFLSKLPPAQANTIRAIGEGRVELSPRVMSSKDGKLLMQQLTTAYPNFDQSKAQSYFKTRQDFTSGKTSVGINSYNTSIAHLGTMWDHVSSTNSATLNIPGTQVHRQLDLDKQLVSTELAKAVSNGQMTEGEKNQILGSISGYTVGSYQDRIKEAVTLLTGKLEAYQQQWNNGAPPGAVSQIRILGPRAEATIAKIRGLPNRQVSQRVPPSGATHTAMGSDKRLHYTNAQGQDLGVVQ